MKLKLMRSLFRILVATFFYVVAMLVALAMVR